MRPVRRLVSVLFRKLIKQIYTHEEGRNLTRDRRRRVREALRAEDECDDGRDIPAPNTPEQTISLRASDGQGGRNVLEQFFSTILDLPAQSHSTIFVINPS